MRSPCLKMTRTAALLARLRVVIPAAGCARNKSKRDTAYVARDVNTPLRARQARLDQRRL